MRERLSIRLMATGVVWAAYAATFLILAPRLGAAAASFATVPALLGGYLLGWRGGVLMGPVSLLANELLLASTGRSLQITASDLYYASLSSVIGAGVGWVQGIRIELREANQTARESVERYQLVTRATSDVIWDWDMATNSLWWSENFQHVFGHLPSENERDATSWTRRIHPDDLPRVLAGLRAVVDADPEDQWSDEYRFQRRDGSYAVVSDRGYVLRDAQGRAIRMLGSMQDVTALKAGQCALRESEAAFRTLFENVPIGLYRTTPSGRIVLANPALLTMLGYDSLEELQDRDLNKDAEPNYHRAQFKAALGEKRVLRNLVSTWTTRQGAKLPVREDVRLVSSDSGEPLYYEGSVEDISERLRLEQDAATQRRALERNEHLSALGTLVAGVAHEVNNPLAYIRGNVEMVQMALDDLSVMDLPPDARRAVTETEGMLTVALRGIDQLATIAHSLKVVARRSGGARAPENVDKLVKSVLLIAEARMPTTAVIQADLHATRPVDVVSDQLTQVLLNLVFNSADAVRDRAEGLILVRTYEKESSIVIEVTDNGVGIPADERPKIFVPFHTTKDEGTGLGLSLSYGIVRSLGGTLSFESEHGKGTTFRVVLPTA